MPAQVEVKVGDFVSVSIEALEDGYGATRLSRDKAKRMAAWLELEKALETGEKIEGHDHRQGEGRPHRHGQRHPRLPAGLAGRPAAGEGHHAVRRQDDGVQGHQARPQAQQRGRVAPRGARGDRGRRAREPARLAAGRRHRQGHRQEHHRLRRVRRPGRHRRPAAHHRSRLAARQASLRGAERRRRSHRQGPQVRLREEPRLAGPEAARRRSLGRHRAPLSAGHAPVRQGHQPHRLRRVRRGRVGHRGPGARLRDGLDQQERASRPRWCRSATRSR